MKTLATFGLAVLLALTLVGLPSLALVAPWWALPAVILGGAAFGWTWADLLGQVWAAKV